MKRKALCVGVNNYKDDGYATLTGAHNDAATIRSVLEGFPKGARFEVAYLTDPTAADVEDALRNLVEETDEDSVLVFYFAGHGLVLPNQTGQSLLCRDASPYLRTGQSFVGAILPTTLRAIAQSHRGKMFACFDVCRSATVWKARGETRQAGGQELRDSMAFATSTAGTTGIGWVLNSTQDGGLASDDGSFANALADVMRETVDCGRELRLCDAFVADVVARMRNVYGNERQLPVASGVPFALASGTPRLQTALERTEQAATALAARRYAEAERLANEALTFEPNSSEATKLRDEARRRRHDQEEFARRNYKLDRALDEGWLDFNKRTDDGVRRALAKAYGVLESRPNDESAMKLKSCAENFIKNKEEETARQSRELDLILNEGWLSLNKRTEDALRQASANADRVLTARPNDASALILKERAKNALQLFQESGANRPTLFVTSSVVAALVFIAIAIAAWLLWAAPRFSVVVDDRDWRESSTRPAGLRQEIAIDGEKYGFCWIPAGEFDMGSPESEPCREVDETLRHVKLTKGFWMLETPVTQRLYKQVMKREPSGFRGDDLPVEQVDFLDVVRFCERLTKRLPNGMKAAIPTEAQWEYACRAGTTTPYSFGYVLDGGKANCNGAKPYGTTTRGMSVGQTTTVKSYPANPWGLYDMHGNVWEWISDWYAIYPAEPTTDPVGSRDETQRVVRGGAWTNNAEDCRSANRGTIVKPNQKFSSLGFRFLLRCD